MKRLLTSLALIPAVLYVILWGPAWLVLAVVGLVASICYWEYCGIASAHHPDSKALLADRRAMLAGWILLLVSTRDGLLLMVLIALAVIVERMRSIDLSLALPSAAVTALGLVYVFGSWKLTLLLHAIDPYWMLYAVAINWAGDAGAYYVGRAFGRNKLAPRISPGKSWEGTAASAVSAVLFGLIFARYLLPNIAPLHIAGLSLLVNAAGQLGDLAESAFKRGAGVKDSGSLLPGHGGMLDRVDSTMFTGPVVYALLQISGVSR